MIGSPEELEVELLSELTEEMESVELDGDNVALMELERTGGGGTLEAIDCLLTFVCLRSEDAGK